MVISMDALFGLPRKKSAGISYSEPLNENLYFLFQVEVNKFVNQQTCVDHNNVWKVYQGFF